MPDVYSEVVGLPPWMRGGLGAAGLLALFLFFKVIAAVRRGVRNAVYGRTAVGQYDHWTKYDKPVLKETVTVTTTGTPDEVVALAKRFAEFVGSTDAPTNIKCLELAVRALEAKKETRTEG